MEINLIWAQTFNNIIGQKLPDGKYYMPWNRNSEDMKHFKKMTSGEGKAILMGYNTYCSIEKKTLPNRENFVLTNSHYDEINVLFDSNNEPNLFNAVKSFDECIRICEFLNINELWVIGGKQVFDLVLNNYTDKISKIYRTIIPNVLSTNSDTVIMQEIPDKYFIQTANAQLKTCQIQEFSKR